MWLRSRGEAVVARVGRPGVTPRWLSVHALLLMALAATALTFFSLFTIHRSAPLVSFRHAESWKSSETLAIVPPASPVFGPRAFADPSWLARLYASLAASDAVVRLAFPGGLSQGRVETAAVPTFGSPLTRTSAPPLVVIDGFATSRMRARQIATRISRALRTYVTQRETVTNIPLRARVRIESVLAQPGLERVDTARTTKTVAGFGFVILLLLLAGLSTHRRSDA